MSSKLLSTFAALSLLLALVTLGPLSTEGAALANRNPTSGLAASLDLGCPSPPGAPHGIQVWIHVTQWCGLPAVRRQAQFKLQLQIYNSGGHALGIRTEHLRLIVANFDIAKWSPPRYGQMTVERPFRTTYHGQHVWAIPPNAENAYDPVPGVPGDLTFATHWNQTQLGAQQVFRPSYHKGDLVFYVPYLPHDYPGGAATAEDVLGMAYVYRDEIVVLCPKERWGPKEPAATF
jgi:hypothetical protein